MIVLATYLAIGAAIGVIVAVWTFLSLGNSPIKSALYTALAAFVLVTILWLPLAIIILILRVR